MIWLWLTIAVAVIGYHFYVAFKLERAKAPRSVQLLAIILLSSVPLLGAVLVHMWVIGTLEDKGGSNAPHRE